MVALRFSGMNALLYQTITPRAALARARKRRHRVRHNALLLLLRFVRMLAFSCRRRAATTHRASAWAAPRCARISLANASAISPA